MISHHGTLTLVDKLEFKILHLYVTISFQKTFSKKASGSLNGMVNSDLIKKVYTHFRRLIPSCAIHFLIISRIDKTKVNISLI